MASLVKFEVQSLPALKAVGRAVRVRMADEMDDPVHDLWARCHGDGTFDDLSALETWDPSYIGWMGDFDARTNSFVYLAGMLLNAEAAVPEGFDVRSIQPARVAVGWVKGEPDELVPLAQDITEQAMVEADLVPDEDAGWVMELCNCPRYTEPGPDGEVVIDFYVPCREVGES